MKWLDNVTVAKKLLLIFIFVFIPIMLVSLLVNNLSMKVASQKIIESYSNSILLLGSKIDDSLEKYRFLACAVAVDPDINAVNVPSLEDSGDIEYYRNLTRVLNNLRVYSYTNELNADITVYLKKASRYVSTQWGMDFIKESDEVLAMDDSDYYKWFYRMKKYGNSSKEVISYIQNAVYNLPQQGTLVTIDVDMEDLRKLLDEFKNPEDSLAFIVLPQNKVISNSSAQNIEDIALLTTGQSSNLGVIEHNQNGTNYKIIYYKSEKTGLISGISLADKTILQPIITIRVYIVAFILLGIILAVFFSYSVYKTILIPFNKIVDAMRQVKDGDFKVRIPDENNGEMAFVFSQFNSMANQIDYLINEVYENKVSLQKSNLKLLHSQIKPHFLFNCLNFIYRMSVAGDFEGIGNMSLFLGKYFRYATRIDKDYTTLREELENIGSYVRIQQMRFPGRIILTQQVPPEISSIKIPRLLIQPIIENSILHGLEKIDDTIRIEVRACTFEKMIIVTVEDDGKGINDDDFLRITNNIRELKDDESSYGLSNIYSRLKLEFGETAEMKLEQIKPKGIRVVISIPVYPKEDLENV